MLLCVCFFCFFFFQAEDGIRDLTVTGVQTCALPIYVTAEELGGASAHSTKSGVTHFACANERSEERRVGKSVDLGGRRIIKKKKKKKKRNKKKNKEKNKTNDCKNKRKE